MISGGRGIERNIYIKGWFVDFVQIGRAIECGRYLCEWPGEEKLAKIGKPFLAACAPPGTYPPAPTSPGDDRMWHCHGANYAELVSNLQSESSLTLLLCPRLPPTSPLLLLLFGDCQHELNPVTTCSNLHSPTLPADDRSLRKT